MKKLLLIITLISFLGIAVFGFVGIHSSMNAGVGCVSERINGGLCTEENPIAIASFHLDAFQQVWTAVIVVSLLGVFGVVMAFRKVSEEENEREITKQIKVTNKERERGGNILRGTIGGLYKWYCAQKGFSLSLA